MKQQPSGLAELDQALEALDAIIRLRDGGRESFDASEDRRWALAFLWISVGSALKQFCRLRGIEQGSSPFLGPSACVIDSATGRRARCPHAFCGTHACSTPTH